MAKTNKSCNNNYRNNKTGGKGKFSRNQNRKSTYEENSKDDLKGKTSARNDSGWYQADSVLMKDAANLPFPNALGMPLQLRDALSGVSPFNGQFTLPGIMRINVVTTPGTMGDWNDPINVAIRDIYSFVRHQNSGSKNYDAADLGVYFYAYDSCATYYAYLVRIYGTVRTLLMRNRYTPEDLITVMGVDYKNITDNLAQLRAYINTFAARLAAMRVPSDLHFIERHMWLFSHIFADSNTDKCQMYIVNPAAFWEYKVGQTADKTGFFMSEKVPQFGALYDFERLTVFGNALLNSVLNSEDFNIMSGDILKAYGDKTFTISMISEDYTVPIVYEPEFLLQLHNATVCKLESTLGDDKAQYMKWVIQQDYSTTPNVGALTANLDMSLETTEGTTKDGFMYALGLGLQQPLDMPVENPTPELVAIATRMKISAIYTNTVGDKKVMRPYAYGTEIVVGVWIYNKDSATRTLDIKSPEFLFNASERLCFSVCPLYYTYVSSDVSTGSISNIVSLIGSVDNITMLPASVLYNIHRAALLGMFGLAK